MKFLAVGAHPDDIESNAGGILTRLKHLGHEVGYVICTDGSKGSTIMEDGQHLKGTRQREQQGAGAVIGVDKFFFFDFVDGELEAGLKLRFEIVKAIREFQPDVVLSWDPSSYWLGDFAMNHPDHMAVGRETAYAVYPSARDNLMFPELYRQGLPGFKTRELWMFGSNHPNFFIDVHAEFGTKIEALGRHASQVAPDTFVQGMHVKNAWLCRDFVNSVTADLREHPEYIEAFRRVALDPIADLIASLGKTFVVTG